MQEQPILVQKGDRIGWITLNRTEDMNTFNVPFAQGLNEALRSLDEDDTVHVVVIQAAGRRFSVGISLDELKGKSHKEFRQFLSLMDEFYHIIPEMKKPVIASVQGPALANGAGIVLSTAPLASAGGPVVPEPHSIAIWAIVGLGLAGFGCVRYRRKR